MTSVLTTTGAATAAFVSVAIPRGALVAAGRAVVLFYSHESMILNPGAVTATWTAPDTEVAWTNVASVGGGICQQAVASVSVTRQADMTVTWEL